MLQNVEILSKEMLEGFYFETESGSFEMNINSSRFFSRGSLFLPSSHPDARSDTEIWHQLI